MLDMTAKDRRLLLQKVSKLFNCTERAARRYLSEGLTSSEVMAALGCSFAVLCKFFTLPGNRKLKSYRRGGRRMVPLSDLASFCASSGLGSRFCDIL
jgi:hypothetical protein